MGEISKVNQISKLKIEHELDFKNKSNYFFKNFILSGRKYIKHFW